MIGATRAIRSGARIAAMRRMPPRRAMKSRGIAHSRPVGGSGQVDAAQPCRYLWAGFAPVDCCEFESNEPEPWIFGPHSQARMSNDHFVHRQSAGLEHPIPRQFERLEPSAIQTRIRGISSADSACGPATPGPRLEFVESAKRSSFRLERPLQPPRMTAVARPVVSARAIAIRTNSSNRRPDRATDCG